jgi:hypothetical protein
MPKNQAAATIPGEADFLPGFPMLLPALSLILASERIAHPFKMLPFPHILDSVLF